MAKEEKKGNFDKISFFWTQWHKPNISRKLRPNQIYAKIDGNYLLTNKTNLLITMCQYNLDKKNDKFKYLPKTYNFRAEADMSAVPEFDHIK